MDYYVTYFIDIEKNLQRRDSKIAHAVISFSEIVSSQFIWTFIQRSSDHLS